MHIYVLTIILWSVQNTMKIKIKLIIIAAVLLIITMAAFSVFLSIQLDSTARTMFDTYLSDVARMQAVNIDDYANDVSSRFKMISELPAVQAFTSGNFGTGTPEYKNIEAALEPFVTSGAVKSVVVFNDGNDVLFAKGANDTVTNASGICKTTAADGVPAIFNEDSKKSYDISVKGKVHKLNLGVVFTNNEVSNIIQQAKGLVFIVDPFDSIALVSQTYGGNYSEGKASSQYAAYKDIVAAANDSAPVKYEDGVTVAFAAASGSGWKAVAVQESKFAINNSSNASSAVTGVAVAMIVVFLVVCIILVITVTKPFYKIQDTLIKISRGDHEARVDIMSKNEYGDIARVFNDIVDNIIVSESRYRTIIEMSDNIIFEWNLSTKEVIFSNNFNKKFSYRAPSEHFADSFLIKCKVHPEDAERYTSDLSKLEKGENFKHNEYRIKNIYGDYIWVLIRTSSIVDQEGKTVKIVGVIVDIDRAKKSENILTARASFDSLTNVFNRETIEVAINNEIELIAARKTEFAILFVDIDDFKFFNDQYSHATGDQVLRFTATTIKNAVGDKGMVGRYGGDEFIVCIKDADTNDPAVVAEQILNTLKEGFDSDSGDHLNVNVSIGISVIKDNTKRVEEIIGQADDAMYKIKKNGKSNFGFLET